MTRNPKETKNNEIAFLKTTVFYTHALKAFQGLNKRYFEVLKGSTETLLFGISGFSKQYAFHGIPPM